eukprot:5624958-Alexandrium_andersonii.AAC.1
MICRITECRIADWRAADYSHIVLFWAPPFQTPLISASGVLAGPVRRHHCIQHAESIRTHQSRPSGDAV